MSAARYTVLLSPAAKRAIERDLREAVATAVVDFLYGPLASVNRAGHVISTLR